MEGRPKRTVRIRTSLIRNLVLLISILAGSLLTASLLGARGAIRDVSRELIQSKVSSTEQRLQAFFDPIRDNLELLRTIGQLTATVDPENTATLNRFFAALTARHPQISSANTGDAHGNGYMLLRDADGGWRNRVVRREAWGSETRWQKWSAAGELERAWKEDLDYDPRARDWYRGLLERGGPEIYWTRPYTFFTTKDLGITASIFVQPDEGEPYVVAFDVLLADLTRFTQGLEVSDHGTAFITTEDGRLLGLPRHASLSTPDEQRAAFLRPVAAVAAEFVEDASRPVEQEEGFFRFESGGEVWLGGSQGYALGGRQLEITIVLPQDDVLGDIHRRRIELALATAGALLLAVLIAVRLSRKYSRPLRDLVAHSERMGRLELDEPSPVVSNLREVDRLAAAQDRMRGALLSFSRYVPVDLVRQLIERGEAAEIGGRTEQLSVLFTDIREFTTIAEGLSPAELTGHMADYFGGMVDNLREHGATIDKFVGDAIVAFWGAPDPDPDHIRHAVEGVLSCRDHIRAQNRRWREEGKPVLPTCFGLSAGEVVVGNIGAPSRLSYTALGDTVNVASRIEGLNRYYGTEVLVTAPVRKAMGETFAWREVDLVAVKGRHKAVEMYELLGRAGEVAAEEIDWAHRYEGALAWYRTRSFARALEVLLKLERERPGDLSVTRLRSLCEEYIENPPSEDWDGVVRMQVK